MSRAEFWRTLSCYLTVAALVAGVQMELVDTTVRDVTIVADYLTGRFSEDSKGITVRVHGLL